MDTFSLLESVIYILCYMNPSQDTLRPTIVSGSGNKTENNLTLIRHDDKKWSSVLKELEITAAYDTNYK